MERLPWFYLGLYGLLIVAGLPLVFELIPPNPWYGFRLPGAILSEVHWYQINSIGGKMFILSMFICASLNLIFMWKIFDRVRPQIGIINIGLIFLSFWIVTQALVDRLP